MKIKYDNWKTTPVRYESRGGTFTLHGGSRTDFIRHIIKKKSLGPLGGNARGAKRPTHPADRQEVGACSTVTSGRLGVNICTQGASLGRPSSVWEGERRPPPLLHRLSWWCLPSNLRTVLYTVSPLVPYAVSLWNTHILRYIWIHIYACVCV